MPRVPSIRIQWVASKKSGTIPYLQGDIPTGVVDEAGKKRFHRLNRSLGPLSTEEAERILSVCKLTLRRMFHEQSVPLPPPNISKSQLVDYLKTEGKAVGHITISTKTLSEVIDLYKAATDNDESTDVTTAVHCRHLLSIIKDKPFCEITYNDLLKYKKERAKKVSNDTIIKEFATLSLIWKEAKKQKIVSGECPVSQVEIRSNVDKLNWQPFSVVEANVKRGLIPDDELDMHWESAFLEDHQVFDFLDIVRDSDTRKRHPWIYPAVAMCALTGCRRSEMLRSQRVDINTSGLIRLREKKRKKRQAGSFRDVPCHRELAKILNDWLASHPGGTYTICDSKGEPLTGKAAWYHFQQAVKGTKYENIKGYHTFRHSFISILIMKGQPEKVIDLLAGHTSTVRERYQHLIPSDAQETVDTLSLGNRRQAISQDVIDI